MTEIQFVGPVNDQYLFLVQSLHKCFQDVPELKTELDRVTQILALDAKTALIYDEIRDDTKLFAKDIHSRCSNLCEKTSKHPAFFDRLLVHKIYPRLAADEKDAFWSMLAEIVQKSTTQNLLGSHGKFMSKLVGSIDLKGQNAQQGTKNLITKLMSDPLLRNEALALMGTKGGTGFFGNVGDMMNGYGLTATSATQEEEEDDPKEGDDDLKEEEGDVEDVTTLASEIVKQDCKKKRQNRRRKKKQSPEQNPLCIMAEWAASADKDIDMEKLQKELAENIESQAGGAGAFVDLISKAAFGSENKEEAMASLPIEIMKMMNQGEPSTDDQQAFANIFVSGTNNYADIMNRALTSGAAAAKSQIVDVSDTCELPPKEDESDL